MIFKLTASFARPVWLTVRFDIPVMSESGILPQLPEFVKHRPGKYGQRLAAELVGTDGPGYYKVGNYYIIVTRVGMRGHAICLPMMFVKSSTDIVQYVQDPSYMECVLNYSLLNCSYGGKVKCIFRGKLGSLVVVIGNAVQTSFNQPH